MKIPKRRLLLLATLVHTIAASKLLSSNIPRTLQSTAPYALRISSGATESWMDTDGTTWESDTNYTSNGAIYSKCPLTIAKTTYDELYCKERYFNRWQHNGPYRYDISVPNNGAAYSVKLHFVELYFQTTGARIFDVLVGRKTVYKNLDIYKEVGYLSAFILPIVTTSTNETISIELKYKKENPTISAIEIIEIPNYIAPTTSPISSSQGPLPFALRINAGATDSYTDDNDITWESDKYFDGQGDVQNHCPLDINGTGSGELYCQYRYFNIWKYKAPFQYEIPVPKSGAYTVKLHFAETHYQTSGERIFDVVVGGKVVLGSMDIFTEAGFSTAYILSAITRTSTGFVTIELVPKVEHPTICAIEIIELPGYVAPPTAAPVARPFEILINSGSIADYHERSGSGRIWMADKYFIGGGVLFKRHYDIQWTPDDEVFHIERHGEFRYEVPVLKGMYEVLLHFTELHWDEPGKRLFNVGIEETTLFQNIDLFKMAGGIRRAFVIQHTLPITDGLLSIAFRNSNPRVDMPKVSGIEIRYINSSTKSVNLFPLYINCGGNGFIENGKTWFSDRFFIGGLTYDRVNTTDIQQRIPNELYHTGRFGPFRYEIAAPVGIYEVTLHFAETSLSGNGTRVFNVSLEDVVTYPELDIVAMGGGLNFLPMVVKSRVTVTDGLLSIAFVNLIPDRKNPIVSGIEVKFIRKLPIVKAPVVSSSTKAPSRAPILIPTTLAPIPISVPVPNRNCTIPRFKNRNGWSKPYAPYPITVAEPAGDLIGTDMVLFSGFKNGYVNATREVYALDLSQSNTATWQRMDDIPFEQGITHQGVVVIGMKAYLCGGYIGGSLGLHTDQCFIYDHSQPNGTQWSTFTPLPNGGRSGGGMIYDSTLHAIIYAGGSQRTTQGQRVAIDFKDSWMYSFNNPTAGWVPKTDIPFFGNHMNSVTVLDATNKERHYIFGGQVGDYELWGNTAIMYEYITTTDTWVKRTSMPFPRGHTTSAVRPVGCGGFIIAGGRTNTGLTGDITYYNIGTGRWQSIGTLPVNIHTNVCVIYSGILRCETGWATGTFSTEIPIEF